MNENYTSSLRRFHRVPIVWIIDPWHDFFFLFLLLLFFNFVLCFLSMIFNQICKTSHLKMQNLERTKSVVLRLSMEFPNPRLLGKSIYFLWGSRKLASSIQKKLESSIQKKLGDAVEWTRCYLFWPTQVPLAKFHCLNFEASENCFLVWCLGIFCKPASSQRLRVMNYDLTMLSF